VSPENVKTEVDSIISLLIKFGFADRYNFTSQKVLPGGNITVEYSGLEDISIALKDRPYAESYSELLKREQFSIKMLDGAIIQLMYKFDGAGKLLKHRLCFMPSPFNHEFQNEPEIYLEDQIYAEVVDKRILPVTIRFDFDPSNAIDIHHPGSHFTLGQYKNCRIAVSGPLTPSIFIEFILRSFYNTAFTNTVEIFSLALTQFEQTITPQEKQRLHLSIL
jgi:hypothetical protein